MGGETAPTLYFGYGSNLWLHQMAMRCPTSEFVGLGRLPNWQWIINERGYANVVEDPLDPTVLTNNTAHEVWGLVYTLQPIDETRLDRNEGVPESYTKEMHDIEFWSRVNDSSSVEEGLQGLLGVAPTNVGKPSANKTALVYVDRKRLVKAKPKHEYIYRMNMGIEDAVAVGVPEKYVDQVLRRFIPRGTYDEGRILAMEQARQFKEDA